MASLSVFRAPQIEAEIVVPGDKSISHRAVLLAAISNGSCAIRGFLPSHDCQCTVQAMRSLGILIDQPTETSLMVHGQRGKFQRSSEPIDCGNSGTLMRLMCGLAATQPFETVLVGDASLSSRPMRRVIEPLALMGASIEATEPTGTAPLKIRGGNLRPITYELPVASAQVKSAVLLAALGAPGKTTVIEPITARDHTERILNYFLIETRRETTPRGQAISIYGEQIAESRDFSVPGDFSSAAFWMVAAAGQEGSNLLVRDVGLNETRTGALAVLLRMGAHVREVVQDSEKGEPRGEIHIQGTRLHGTVIGGQEIPNLIDEIPILAIAGALAQGKTIIRDAHELRVKETDRLAAIAANLTEMGVDVVETEDGLEINGGAPLIPGRLKSYGDHRIAMAFAIAGMFADGETIIDNTDCIATSYPGFEEQLQAFLDPRHEQPTPVINPAGVIEKH
ncbi:MAG TPA: 3-phosphoshikimate 1-carboxyvinyltransferase [Chthoniobacterales bacterium]|nr:3-phosphoshikimate 1-carboxyvinyltransferase [Chthoniobacterales bacterium]